MDNRIFIKDYSLRQLKNEFEKQVFALPELQRVFVWDKNKICKLMDSIFNNYPVGTAMIWEINRDKGITIRHNEIALPPFDPIRNKNVKFIIDGQQRLSVLYNILTGKKVISNKQEIDFRNVYFSLNMDYNKSFYYLNRSDDNKLIPLTDILQRPPSWFKNKYNKSEVTRILKCKQQFLNYRIFFLTTTTKEIEEVRETFIRINSLGTPVSSSDRAFARATNIDLRKLVSTLKNRFNSGFEAIPDSIILTSIALIEGSNEVGEKAIEYFINKIVNKEIENQNFQKKWRKMEQAIGKAIDFLKVTFNIDDYKYLPSTNMLSTLSYFYYYNNKQPDSKQRTEIRKWFWHTGIASRYSGRGYRQNILGDVEFFTKLAKNSAHKYSVNEKLPHSELMNVDYSKNTSLGAAYYLLLKRNTPRYLENGEPIVLFDYSTIANRSDKHHIFPRNFLSRIGLVRKKINCIVNICLLVAQENQIIGGSSPPKKYLEKFINKRFFSKVMKSHYIPYSKTSSLWGNTKPSYYNFLEERKKLIIDAFEKAAGIQIFE